MVGGGESMGGVGGGMQWVVGGGSFEALLCEAGRVFV